MRGLRVCLLTPVSDMRIGGGIGTHVRMVYNALQNGGHDVTVISGGRTGEEAGLKTLWVEDAPPNTFSPLFWKSSRRIFEDSHSLKPYDAVLCQGTCGYGLLAVSDRPPLIALMHQFKPVHLFNSALEIDTLRTLGIYALKTVPRAIKDGLLQERPFLQSCDGIFCGANHMAEKISSFYQIHRSKIKVVPNWADTDANKPDPVLRKHGRSQWNIPENAFTVLLFGRIQKTKGVEAGLRAFAAAFRDDPEAILTIAGTGEQNLLENYKRLADNLAVRNRVRFLGPIKDNDVPMLYNSSDVYVMPSIILEELPYTIVEAMSAALPVIAVDRPGNIEALGENGLFFPPNGIDSLSKSLRDLKSAPERSRALGFLNKKRAYEKFSSKGCEVLFNQAFSDLMATHSKCR